MELTDKIFKTTTLNVFKHSRDSRDKKKSIGMEDVKK